MPRNLAWLVFISRVISNANEWDWRAAVHGVAKSRTDRATELNWRSGRIVRTILGKGRGFTGFWAAAHAFAFNSV